MHGLPRALGAALLLMPCAVIADPVIRVARTPAGVALDWTGGMGLTDVVAIDLASIRSTTSDVELGTVRSIECASVDATTRNGNEDVSTSQVIGYLAGSGGNYGPASSGKPRTIAAGDCTSAGPLTQSRFCQRWRQDNLIQCTDPWSGNPAPQGCDAGAVSSVAVQDALRLTNLYRWMAGLAPVSVDPALSAKCQDGAVLLRDLGYLTHQPEPGSACYTAAGDAAVGSSNISAGYVDLADSVDAYLADYGIPTLGHRRWLLHPPLQKTGFGFVEGAGTYAVQWIIGSGSTVAPAFVAWPSAGWFPSDAPVGRWSFSVRNAVFTSATVRVTRVSDGRPMTVSAVEALPNGYSWPAIAYDVAGVTAGNDYRIVIDGVTGAAQTRYEYVTQWCNCP